MTTTTVVALTGAPAPMRSGAGPATCTGPSSCPRAPRCGWAHRPSGLRTYVAVRGGIAVDAVLGSRATDTVAGLGPAVLEPGVELPVGEAPPSPVPPVDVAPEPPGPRAR